MPRPFVILILVLLAARPPAQAQAQAQPASSQPQPQPAESHPATDVGNIAFDPALDDPHFHIHDSTRMFQYYSSTAQWLDHKEAYRRVFAKTACELPGAIAQTQSGWLTIRFVINTDSLAGRFRVLEIDSNYRSYHFDAGIVSCLLNTVKTCRWYPARYRGRIYDTYQYVSFHLEQGRIADILP
jgi:hypothetical protein